MPVNKLEIRSEEVHEILGLVPRWIIRWGTTFIFILLLMSLAFAWLIKYPDTVQGQVILTTQTPPVRLVSQTNGTIERIYVADNAWVDTGTPIAKITNPVSEHALTYLQEFLFEVQESLGKHPNQSQVFTHTSAHDYILGDIQEEYNNLRRLFQDYETLVKSTYHQTRLQGIKTQIENHRHLASMIEQQLLYVKRELANEEKNYEAYQQLYAKGGIAKLDLFDKETRFLTLKQALEQQKKELLKNDIVIEEYELQLQELTFAYAEKLRTLKASIHASVQSIKNYIRQWQQHYTIKAPLAGTVSYLHTFSKEHFVRLGEELFTLVPQEEEYIAYAQVPSQGYGKIKPGQQARIKLSPYPYQEYGYLSATVKEIASISTQAKYRVTLQLEKNLLSTYGRALSFKPEMYGWAEIITEDMSLLQRIINKIFGLSRQ